MAQCLFFFLNPPVAFFQLTSLCKRMKTIWWMAPKIACIHSTAGGILLRSYKGFKFACVKVPGMVLGLGLISHQTTCVLSVLWLARSPPALDDALLAFTIDISDVSTTSRIYKLCWNWNELFLNFFFSTNSELLWQLFHVNSYMQDIMQACRRALCPMHFV